MIIRIIPNYLLPYSLEDDYISVACHESAVASYRRNGKSILIQTVDLAMGFLSVNNVTIGQLQTKDLKAIVDFIQLYVFFLFVSFLICHKTACHNIE